MTIYADNAATTKMCREAIEAMLPYMDKIYGNPSSLHSVGLEAAHALAGVRETVAECLGCSANEITFTSGGSEANNQALISAAELGAKKARSTSSPRRLSITRSCTRSKSWRAAALK